MIRSMTGFSRGVITEAGLTVLVEIKSLNHRFLDIFTRLPRGFNSLDITIKNYIKNVINRGRIEISLNIQFLAENGHLLEVDYDLAKQYLRCLKKLNEELGLENVIGIQDILRFSDVIRIKEEFSEDEMWPTIQKAFDIALEKLIDMRSREGMMLSEDIQARLELILGNLQVISQRIPVSLEEYRTHLSERIRDLFKIEIPNERMEQEMVLYAERSDITEEKVRIDTHINQMMDLLKHEGPVGRKMDFLVQELYREVNTLGAKTSDLSIINNVIEIKSELERIREQAQNIE